MAACCSLQAGWTMHLNVLLSLCAAAWLFLITIVRKRWNGKNEAQGFVLDADYKKRDKLHMTHEMHKCMPCLANTTGAVLQTNHCAKTASALQCNHYWMPPKHAQVEELQLRQNVPAALQPKGTRNWITDALLQLLYSHDCNVHLFLSKVAFKFMCVTIGRKSKNWIPSIPAARHWHKHPTQSNPKQSAAIARVNFGVHILRWACLCQPLRIFFFNHFFQI